LGLEELKDGENLVRNQVIREDVDRGERDGGFIERCNRNNIRILPIIVILIIKSHKKTIKNKFTKS